MGHTQKEHKLQSWKVEIVLKVPHSRACNNHLKISMILTQNPDLETKITLIIL